MEAQQIKSNINRLMDGIEDKAFLHACYEAVNGIAKAYRQVADLSNGAAPAKKSKPKTASSNGVAEKLATPASADQAADEERSQPHDLSLVLLANAIFKGSEPAPPEASVAFRRAFLKNASKVPILPKR